jgi:hypothetical protein
LCSYSAYEARVDGVLLMQLQVLVSSEGKEGRFSGILFFCNLKGALSTENE